MTSFLTTGGIRGKKQIGAYHPRSFNMGITKRYFKNRGYRIPFMGEDLEFSIRIITAGFKTVLIPNAFVYHKRRTNLIQFYKQINFLEERELTLTRFHPGHLKILHLFPLIFIIGFICTCFEFIKSKSRFSGIKMLFDLFIPYYRRGLT